MRILGKLVLVVVGAAFLAANTAVAGGYYGGHYRGGYKGYKHYPKPYKHHRHYKYDNGDVGLALGLGLLFGTLLGHALSAPRYDFYDRSPGYRYQRDYYEYEPPRIVYREVVPSYRRVQPVSRCLQEREYQTTVVIDGKRVEAYGTTCLQPDGSWRRGAAKLMPDYQ